MGELTTRDDFKDTFAYPRLYYPGMLLALSSGAGPEQHVTVLEVHDLNGPWVKLVWRPTSRMDRVWDWFRQRRLDVLLMLPRRLRGILGRVLGVQPTRRAAIWTAKESNDG